MPRRVKRICIQEDIRPFVLSGVSPVYTRQGIAEKQQPIHSQGATPANDDGFRTTTNDEALDIMANLSYGLSFGQMFSQNISRRMAPWLKEKIYRLPEFWIIFVVDLMCIKKYYRMSAGGWNRWRGRC